jgi:hypothetical protein
LEYLNHDPHGGVEVKGETTMSYIPMTCPVCDTEFRAERNEDGDPEIPDSIHCADPACSIWLCPGECQEHFSWQCTGCGGRFCHLHTPTPVGGDRFCAVCELETIDVETGCTPAEMAGPRNQRPAAERARAQLTPAGSRRLARPC